jgi:hypothetical protein
MYLGTTPLLTPGLLARYFGGSAILPDLSREEPWSGYHILLVPSGLLWVAMFLGRRAKTAEPGSYHQALINTLVENRFNIYNGTTIIG